MSNTGQSHDNSGRLDIDRAQQFTTGGNAGGYRLTGAGVAMALTSGTLNYSVSIRSDSSGNPGSALTGGTLTKPAKLPTSHAVVRFTATGTGVDLEPNTNYWLVYDHASGTVAGGISLTSANAEDAGKAAGWSIADTGALRGGGSWTSSTSKMRIGIDAVAKAAVTRPVAGAAVSNTGQTTAGSSTSDNDNAQAFTTGSKAGGYRLTKVDLDMWIDPGTLPAYSVSVHADSSNDPGTSLGALAKPSLGTGGGTRSFTAAGEGIALQPDTRYWVVLDAAAGTNTRIGWRQTSSTAEDAGAAAGWSLDAARTRSSGSSGSWNASIARKMAVHALEQAPATTPPATPAAPTVSETDGTSITVTWAGPAGDTPAVTDYDVRYRRKGDTVWIEHDHTGADTRSATIDGVLRGASWEAQVRAGNSVALSAWSDTGSGHTGPARVERVETSTSGRAINIFLTKRSRRPQSAADPTRYTLRVNGVVRSPSSSWQGTEPGVVSFGLFITQTIEPGATVTVSYSTTTGSGQRASDPDGLQVANFGPVAVTNLVESATAPTISAPTVTTGAAGAGSLQVEWPAAVPPGGIGWEVQHYQLRYFKGSADPLDAGDWIEPHEPGGHRHNSTATSATITGLAGGTAYRVQVRAVYSGPEAWSASGGGTTSTSVPAAPTGLTVAAGTTNPASSLEVSWTAPDTGGSAITDYDVRYFAGSSDPTDEADWVTETETSGLPVPDPTFNWTATSWTIAGLAPNTSYLVQVRARNALGEGAWSASVARTTGTASGTNSAPIRLQLGSSGCVQKTANDLYTSSNAPAGALITAAEPLVDESNCTGTSRKAPMFRDPDGDTLTFTVKARNLPDDVILGDASPFVRPATGGVAGKVFLAAAARFARTDVLFDVTATDPHGASVSTFFRARVGAYSDNNGAPSLAAAAGLVLHVAENEEMEPVVLPAATGGDVGELNSDGDFRFPHLYRVEGLPPGLSFDGPNRRITGTPSKAGTYEVTYTAADADVVVTEADKASETIRIRVGDGPRIHRVRIVSRPTYDSNGDGVNDTYIRGDRILIDVEFGAHQPVKIFNGVQVRLRLDLGADGNTRAANRKGLTQYSQLYGDETLRFVYTVVTGDTDPDGVWVQTGDNNQVVFTVGGTTVAHADSGAGADLTLRGLPTRGDPLHKVDGSKTAADIGPRTTGAAVNGNTLTVDFDEPLNTSVNTGELRWDLAVKGAGGLNTGERTAELHPDSVAVSNPTATTGRLTLTLGVAARPGETVTLSYTGSLLRGSGAGGKKAPMFRDLAVTNNTPGTAGPKPVRATVAGNTLRVVFDGDVARGAGT
ncbi:MAG: fibronectin type III domain-containing protein [Rhodospirillales bacterium]|nr:fibronectin type III domain-containing protein [Rhodospirillales bacterium]